MNFDHIFSYKYTVIRLIVLIIALLSVRIDNVSNYVDIITALGGAIVGAVGGEIIVRLILYVIIKR